MEVDHTIISATRRKLHFNTMTDILADVDEMSSAEHQHLGEWTPAQNIDHVRRLIRLSHSGSEFKVPILLRIMGRAMKSRILRSPMNPGMQTVQALVPPNDLSFSDAAAAFREEISTIQRPGSMCQRSPLLGPLTHAQWEQLHCRHAEHHFGFIVPVL